MKRIPLQVVGSKVLLYDTDDIQKARELGITGILIGTLTKFPQQNLFLSKPMELSFYEVIWLIDNGLGTLVDAAKYNNLLLKNDVEERSNVVNDNMVTYDAYDIHDEQLHEYIIKETSFSVVEFIQRNFPTKAKRQYAIRVYKAYKHIKSLGYFIMPGLKFGGELMCYPGDPLRYHSHLIVNLSEINIRNLIIGGRLSTGVKKLWVLIEDAEYEQCRMQNADELAKFTEEYDVLSFSIEWAGFG